MIKLENLSVEDVEDILVQGDARYFVDQIPLILSFVKAKAIDIFRERVNHVAINSKDLAKINPPQQAEKLLAMKLFEENNIQLIGFERRFKGRMLDVLGEKDGQIIAVECGPCGVHKPIEYLAEGAELWIVTCYLKQDQLLHIFKRGSNWDEFYSKYLKGLQAELRDIKSPLDRL
jgi:hypothetical protein